MLCDMCYSVWYGEWVFSAIWCALVSGKVDGRMVSHGVVGRSSVA